MPVAVQYWHAGKLELIFGNVTVLVSKVGEFNSKFEDVEKRKSRRNVFS